MNKTTLRIFYKVSFLVTLGLLVGTLLDHFLNDADWFLPLAIVFLAWLLVLVLLLFLGDGPTMAIQEREEGYDTMHYGKEREA